MQKIPEEMFAFLEQSPYFYEKRDPFIARTGGMQTDIVYTFYSQESPYQQIAEIVIPRDAKTEIKWKIYNFVDNEQSCTPIYQALNPKMEEMPVWFNILISQAAEIYRRFTGLLKMFNPELKNNSYA